MQNRREGPIREKAGGGKDGRILCDPFGKGARIHGGKAREGSAASLHCLEPFKKEGAGDFSSRSERQEMLEGGVAERHRKKKKLEDVERIETGQNVVDGVDGYAKSAEVGREDVHVRVFRLYDARIFGNNLNVVILELDRIKKGEQKTPHRNGNIEPPRFIRVGIAEHHACTLRVDEVLEPFFFERMKVVPAEADEEEIGTPARGRAFEIEPLDAVHGKQPAWKADPDSVPFPRRPPFLYETHIMTALREETSENTPDCACAQHMDSHHGQDYG